MARTSKYVEDSDNDDEYKPGQNTVAAEEFEEEDDAPKVKKAKAETTDKKRKRETATASTSKESGGESVFQLSSKRRVTVKAFKTGEPMVDIRETYNDKASGELRYGKGICMPLAQWKKLKELMPEIDAAIDRV
ncbi:RNA polymerase II transcriptional coactivator [Apophysomyces sp. BC1034]|nr:RNA polymerase II transcriptional coactivator [Apophysomyces sp. BC1015]KAG0183604.1 RNA polymerase II transcriptional coactivator [Apophysomyces sp. BC1021]KAG0183617.1 RNA polymerase II transcriptional coactivator [Apophysomyces sp. BC1021]KAG0194875.1 RNA polymerase II transcriptional coactivator [Apophysomyces sp. BC1034]